MIQLKLDLQNLLFNWHFAAEFLHSHCPNFYCIIVEQAAVDTLLWTSCHRIWSLLQTVSKNIWVLLGGGSLKQTQAPKSNDNVSA